MANTKIPVELSSTPGIVDNSNATAITIDSSENTTFSGNINLDLTAPTVVFKESGAAKFFIGESSGVGGGSGFYDLYAAAGVGQRFFTAAAERMRIDSSGRVGLGITSPTGSLHIANKDDGGSDVNVHIQNTTANRLAGLKLLDENGTVHGVFRYDNGGNNASLGVGTGSPSATLHVVGNAVITGNIISTGDTNIIYDSDDDCIFSRANGNESMRINSSGRLLIGGTADRGSNLQIGGTSSTARIVPQTDNVGYIGEAAFRWQAIYAVNGSIQTSDKREKTEIKETTLGLDFIKDLKPVSYKWINGEQQNKGKDEREHQGLIAQQVAETVEKHGIDKNNFGGLDIQKTEKYDDFHGMSYDQFVAPLIKAIQEQQTQIEALQSEINELKNS